MVLIRVVIGVTMPRMIRVDRNSIIQRPKPPDELVALTGRNLFMPAPDLLEWIDDSYLDESGLLFTPEHEHLVDAEIACLWTNVENNRRQQRIVGQAEMPGNVGSRLGNKWMRGRVEFQLEQWFGDIPDFLLTFDALYADGVGDVSFCALVAHELFHCAQATDEFGAPAFNKTTGLPKYAIRGHSVEEFVGVVRQFGIEAAGSEAVDFVIAAGQKPTFGRARISEACGTCIRAVA